MNKLESLRLEVDSRRRTVAKLGKKVGGEGRRFWGHVGVAGSAAGLRKFLAFPASAAG